MNLFGSANPIPAAPATTNIQVAVRIQHLSAAARRSSLKYKIANDASIFFEQMISRFKELSPKPDPKITEAVDPLFEEGKAYLSILNSNALANWFTKVGRFTQNVDEINDWINALLGLMTTEDISD